MQTQTKLSSFSVAYFSLSSLLLYSLLTAYVTSLIPVRIQYPSFQRGKKKTRELSKYNKRKEEKIQPRVISVLLDNGEVFSLYQCTLDEL